MASFADHLMQRFSETQSAVREHFLGEDWTTADAVDAPAPPALDEWAEQLSFVPDEDVQRAFVDRFGGGAQFTEPPALASPVFQRIGIEGVGPVNLDLYTVHVPDPVLDGTRATAAEVLALERAHFSLMMNTDLGFFGPYEATSPVDTAFADPDQDPLMAALHIRIPVPIPPLRDDGAVGVVLADDHRFRVATIWTPRDHGHPVSGYREWGVVDEAGGLTMYCRGTDRATAFFGAAAGDRVFRPADLLWKSWQQGAIRLMADRGAQAAVQKTISARYRWSTIKDVYYQPVGRWI